MWVLRNCFLIFTVQQGNVSVTGWLMCWGCFPHFSIKLVFSLVLNLYHIIIRDKWMLCEPLPQLNSLISYNLIQKMHLCCDFIVSMELDLAEHCIELSLAKSLPCLCIWHPGTWRGYLLSNVRVHYSLKDHFTSWHLANWP